MRRPPKPRAPARLFIGTPPAPVGAILAAWACIFLAAGGCGRRSAPKPPTEVSGPVATDQPARPKAQAAAAKVVRGGLTVTVVPAVGISILLDGARVADASPYTTGDLRPGPHMLHVRAMGYHSVTLPLEVPAQGDLPVRVALRPRPPLPFAGAAPVAAAPGAEAPSTTEAPMPAVAPSAAEARHQPLPSGAVPMLLRITTEPVGPMVVDGALVAGDQVRLVHGTGTLALGAIAVSYRIYPGHVLEVAIPHDDAAWYKEDGQLKATSRLRLESRPLHLRRVDGQGRSQTAVLRRLE